MQNVMQALYLTRNARGLPASARRYSWTPSEVSPIREKMVEAFVQLYGRKPFIKVSHGGNDCVKLVQRIPNLDAVTCAADCINHHTPREYLPMDTFERMLALVVRTLQLLAEEEDV